MLRKSHDGSLCLHVNFIQFSFFFSFFFFPLLFSCFLLFKHFFWSILFNCTSRVYFLSAGVNTASPLLIRRLYLERVRYLDRSVQGYGLYFFILSGVLLFAVHIVCLLVFVFFQEYFVPLSINIYCT